MEETSKLILQRTGQLLAEYGLFDFEDEMQEDFDIVFRDKEGRACGANGASSLLIEFPHNGKQFEVCVREET